MTNAVRSLALRKAQVQDKSFLDVKTGKSVPGDMSEVVELEEQVALLKGAARAALGGREIHTTLYMKESVSAGANVAIASSIALAPSASAEWSVYASLYDEAIVDAIDIHWTVGFMVSSPTPNPASASMTCIGYDSTYNTTPGSVVDVCESSQHQLSAAVTAVSYALTPTKLATFHIKIPKGPVANSVAVTGGTGIIANFPGEWMAVGDTADSVGYQRIYVEAPGGTGTMGYQMVKAFHCRFRERT